MASDATPLPLLPSLLDRLIDLEPDVSREPDWARSQGLRQYERSVLRDVEALLNTRQPMPDLAATDGELARSVWTYGLPEFSSVGTGSVAERERLRAAVENTLIRFEPRLRDIKVRLNNPENEHDRTIRLTIEGLLWLDPTPIAITFDTDILPATQKYIVHGK